MLSSNARYIQYKISQPKETSADEDNDSEEEEEEEEDDGGGGGGEEEERQEIKIDFNNNNSFHNYKKLKENKRKRRHYRRKTFNFIVKYLLLITFIVLIIEIIVYLKYFRKASQSQHEQSLKQHVLVNYDKQPSISNTSSANSSSNNVNTSTSSLNYTTIKLIDFKEDLIIRDNLIKFQQSDANFVSFFHSIKQIQIETYKKHNIIIDWCPAIPPSLEGLINFTQLFNNTNLADLITFYENIGPHQSSDNNNNSKTTIDNISDAVTTSLIEFKSETDNLDLLNENKIYGSNVQLGGYWVPHECKSRSKVAIIIPYRDRFVHLAILLRNLHLILQRQMIAYRIFVTEQYGNKTMPFNKGRIMNAAFLEALKIDPTFECFIFHDVDLILEDDRNMYTCSQFPRHMSVAIDKFKYNLPYYYLIGGVFQLKTEHFRLMNGNL